MRYASLSLLFLAAAAPSVAAAQTSQPSQTSQTAQSNANERRVCRNNMDDTGTILGGRRICRTVSEWRRLEDQARDEMDRRRNGTIDTRGNGN